jgi:D-alanine--poly(phosphoribitol) ligase subunit 2
MANAATLHERLHRLFVTALNIDVPSSDLDLFDAGILDSLGFVELLVHLEREFGVTTSVDDLEVENFRSIACIADFIETRGGLPEAVNGGRVIAMRARA